MPGTFLDSTSHDEDVVEERKVHKMGMELIDIQLIGRHPYRTPFLPLKETILCSIPYLVRSCQYRILPVRGILIGRNVDA